MVRNIKLHCRALGFVLVALLCGCARIDTTSNSAMEGALPQLPAGLLDRHRAAQIEVSHLDGNQAFDYSASKVDVGSSLQLTAAPGQPVIEWALWQLALTAGSVPQNVTVNLNVDSGTSAWIGIADYSTSTWELNGPHAASGAKVIAGLGTSHVSPGGNVFVLAAAYSGTQVTVDGIDVEVDVPAPPKFFITGSLKDTRVDLGFANQTVTLSPGNAQSTTDKNGNYTFIDLDPGNYTVLPPTITGYDVDQANIPVDLTSADKTDAYFLYTPQSTDITYTNTIKLLFDATCVECHNAGTPERARLDVYISGDSNDAFHHAEDSLAYVMNNFMPWPPYAAWTMSQKQALQQWIQVYNKAE